MQQNDRGRRLWIAALIAPALIIVLVFVTMPLISALLYSVFSWNGIARGDFVGLENFRLVLLQPPFSSWTYNAFFNNVIVFVALMLVQNGLAFSSPSCSSRVFRATGSTGSRSSFPSSSPP